MGQQPVRQTEFVIGPKRIGEGDGEGEMRLHHGGLADHTVLPGFAPACQVGGYRSRHVALHPPHVSRHSIVPPLPAQPSRGFDRGREISGQSAQVRQAAPRGGSEPTFGRGDALHPATRSVGQPEVSLGLRQVVRGQFDEVIGEQLRREDG
ncbi:hypothetical protein AB5J56_21200 [Streptomyces sp. R21]|uniref:Uncharacterized protein n=1 Tax=Streptomyces sp. R21 TaxID=3238627 RepID=A0AB39P9K3_9ACTN